MYEVGCLYAVNVRLPSGKAEVILEKAEPGKQWSSLGQPVPSYPLWRPTADIGTVIMYTLIMFTVIKTACKCHTL